MKKFKIIDAWISIILIVSFTVLSQVKLDYTFITGYCVVGSWQLLSMVVHSSMQWFTHRKTGRFYYHIIVVAIAILTLLGFIISPVLWTVMGILLFASPVMAVYYTWLCYNEVYVKMQRPMAALR